MLTGQEIREIRKEFGFTQPQMARLLGLSRTATISEIENDRAPLSNAAKLVLAALSPKHRLVLEKID